MILFPRFYCDIILPLHQSVKLPDDCAHHIFVRRLKKGDSLVLFNGEGKEQIAEISSLESRSVFVQVEQTRNHPPPMYPITLVQAFCGADKMDWIIEKATELGVSAIYLVYTSRTQGKLNSEKLLKKQQHWQKVAQAACAQSGRCWAPEIHSPISFEKAILLFSEQIRFFLHPPQDNNSISILAAKKEENLNQPLTLMVGPEGGFSLAEVEILQQKGWAQKHLGDWILRMETATMNALTRIQCWRDQNLHHSENKP
jgi:16S rRNA (uracil1498-N3)-methyltransferase